MCPLQFQFCSVTKFFFLKLLTFGIKECFIQNCYVYDLFFIQYNLHNTRTLLVTSAVKPQASFTFHAVVILLFYVIQTKCCNKSCTIFED